MLELDDTDRQILALMQKDARHTIEALADATNLSPSTAKRRLNKLRQIGAIRAEVAVLDPRVCRGGVITMVVQVTLLRGRIHAVDRFKRMARETPEVQQCWYVTGDCDFMLIVQAQDMADYERLTERLFFDNTDIQRFQTNVTMDTVKSGLTVPVGDNPLQ